MYGNFARMDLHGRPSYSHAEAQRAGDVGLPVRAIKHEHAGETAEEHPVGVRAQLNRYTGAQHHKHCGNTHTRHVKYLQFIYRNVHTLFIIYIIHFLNIII